MSKSLLMCEKTGSQFTESKGWATMLNCCDKGSIFRSKTIQSIMEQINIFDTFIYSTKRVGYRFDPMKINVNGVNPFMSTLKFFENVWFSSCGLLSCSSVPMLLFQFWVQAVGRTVTQLVWYWYRPPQSDQTFSICCIQDLVGYYQRI